MREGAISFDKVEVKFELDEDNEPVGVFLRLLKKQINLLKNSCCLLTKKLQNSSENKNRRKPLFTVAMMNPIPKNLHALQSLVSKFGHKLNLKDQKQISNSLNNLLGGCAGNKGAESY